MLMMLSEFLQTTAIGEKRRLAGSKRQAAGDPMAIDPVHPSSRMSFFLTNTCRHHVVCAHPKSNASTLRLSALETSSSVTVGQVRSACLSLTTSCDWSMGISLLGFFCKSSCRHDIVKIKINVKPNVLNNPHHSKHEVIPSGVFMPGKDGTPISSTSELQSLVRLLHREHSRLFTDWHCEDVLNRALSPPPTSHRTL